MERDGDESPGLEDQPGDDFNVVQPGDRGLVCRMDRHTNNRIQGIGPLDLDHHAGQALLSGVVGWVLLLAAAVPAANLAVMDLIEPTIQVLTDGGATWAGVTHTSDYFTALLC